MKRQPVRQRFSGQTPPVAEREPQPSNPPSHDLPAYPAAALARITADTNLLVRLAATLLAVFERTQHAARHPDMSGLHRHLVGAIKQFEARANEQGIRRETVLSARYLLCSMLDEAVLNTPWGGQSPWGQRPLLSVFHNEAAGGHKSFLIIERMRQRPAENVDFIELSYLCLSLGFQGKYRLMPRGKNELKKVRDELFQIIRTHCDGPERALSPTWRGLGKTRSTLSEYVPMWVLVSSISAALFFSYSGLHYWLYQVSNPMVEELTEIATPDSSKTK